MSPDGEFGSKSFPEVPQKLEVKPEMKPSISPKSESMGLEGIIVNMPQVIEKVISWPQQYAYVHYYICYLIENLYYNPDFNGNGWDLFWHGFGTHHAIREGGESSCESGHNNRVRNG